MKCKHCGREIEICSIPSCMYKVKHYIHSFDWRRICKDWGGPMAEPSNNEIEIDLDG
jgi:hypothetical protein